MSRTTIPSVCQDHHNPAKPPQCKGSPNHQGTRQVWLCVVSGDLECSTDAARPMSFAAYVSAVFAGKAPDA